MAQAYSIWLLPSATHAEPLREAIAENARAYGTEGFEPHVTVLGDVKGSPQEILASLGMRAFELASVELQPREVTETEEHFRAVALSLEGSAPLQSLRGCLEKGFERIGDDIPPLHLSLVYGELSQVQRAAIQASIPPRLARAPISFDRLALVDTSGAVADWKIVEVLPLGQPPQDPSGHLPLSTFLAIARRQSLSGAKRASRGRTEEIEYRGVDPRRDLPPLKAGPRCVFCEWAADLDAYPHVTTIPASDCLAALGTPGSLGTKLLVFDDSISPYPSVRAVEGAFRLLNALAQSSPDDAQVAVCNLPGSGASVPGHFHWQVWPTQIGGEALMLTQLLQNLDASFSTDATRTELDGYLLTEVTAPVRGLKLSFAPQLSAAERARRLYDAVFVRAIHGFQLALSANIYLPGGGADAIVLWRNARNEAPSTNPEWRWGWYEMIGGFPIREAERGIEDYAGGRWRRWVQDCGVDAETADRARRWIEQGARAR